MIRVVVWKVVRRLAWVLAAWAIRSIATRERKSGVMRHVTVWDRSVTKRVARAVLPVPRWMSDLLMPLGDRRLWALIGGALFWRLAGGWWWRLAKGVAKFVLLTVFLKRLVSRIIR